MLVIKLFKKGNCEDEDEKDDNENDEGWILVKYKKLFR